MLIHKREINVKRQECLRMLCFVEIIICYKIFATLKIYLVQVYPERKMSPVIQIHWSLFRDIRSFVTNADMEMLLYWFLVLIMEIYSRDKKNICVLCALYFK